MGSTRGGRAGGLGRVGGKRGSERFGRRRRAPEALIQQGGRLRGSGAELTQELALIYEWSAGRVVRVIGSTARDDIDGARAAAEWLAAERGEAGV